MNPFLPMHHATARLNQVPGLGPYLSTLACAVALGGLLTQARIEGGLGMGAPWTRALFPSVIAMLVAFAQIAMNTRRTVQLTEPAYPCKLHHDKLH